MGIVLLHCSRLHVLPHCGQAVHCLQADSMSHTVHSLSANLVPWTGAGNFQLLTYVADDAIACTVALASFCLRETCFCCS
jgi:hypothetical protein